MMKYNNRQIHIISATNTFSALAISVVVNWLLWKLLGYEVKIWEAGLVTGVFVVLSYVRTYYIQKFFNWFWHKDAF